MTNRAPNTRWYLLAALLVLMGASRGNAQEDGIKWFKDLGQASQAAQKTNQPMLIDFWADWCGPCKVMDEQIYRNPAVIAAVNQKVVAVRLNFDLQQSLSLRYKVESLPYIIFANSYGSEMMHHHGLLEAGDLAAVMQALPPDVSEFNRLDRILQEDKNDFGALLTMGQKLTADGFFESSNGYFQRALKEKQAAKDPSQQEAILISVGNNWLELQDGKDAAETLERCRKEFPQSTQMPEILLGLGKAYSLDEKPDKAKGTLTALISSYPQSDAAQRARELLKTL